MLKTTENTGHNVQDVVEPEESTTEATLDMVYDQEDAALGPDTSLNVQTPAPTVPVTDHGIVIPPEVVASMASGGCTLFLEPILPKNPGDPISFAIKATPIPATTTTPNMTQEPDTSEDEGANSKSDDDFEQNPKKKARGVGSAHRGGQLQSYSLWMRMGITADIRLNSMSTKEACEKWNAPRRRLRQWLHEYDEGDYAGLPIISRKRSSKRKHV